MKDEHCASPTSQFCILATFIINQNQQSTGWMLDPVALVTDGTILDWIDAGRETAKYRKYWETAITKYNTIQNNIIKYNIMQNNTIQFIATQSNTI